MLPTLTIFILTHQRPFYAIPTIYGLRHRLHYAGKKVFMVLDGNSNESDLLMYRRALRGTDFDMSTGIRNLSQAHNMAADMGGDLWLVCLDDYELQKPIDLTPDVEMLMATPQVGMVRLAALAYWTYSVPGVVVYARMVEHAGNHWWALDKAHSTSPHVALMAANLYHRRYWDAYGDIPVHANDMPGECELRGANLFTDKAGPTIAWPMRFGEGDTEPFKHIGYVRSEDYAAKANDRWGAIDVLDSAVIGNVRIA